MSANPSPRAHVWEWIQTALLATNLVWTTLCLGGYLPATLVVTGTLTVALLVAHLLERAASEELVRGTSDETALRSPRSTFHPAGWMLLPFLVYAAANILWVTPVPWLGWQDWFSWAQMIAVFWVVLNGIRGAAPRMVLFGTLLALGVISVVLACYQRFVRPDWLMLGHAQAAQFIGRTSGSFGIPNSLGAFLLLLIPPCVGLASRRRAAQAGRVFFGWVAGVLLFGLFLTISRGGWIAIGFALSFWPLLSRRWKLRRRLIVAGGVVLLTLLTLGTLYWKVPKVRDRFAVMARDVGERSRPIMWRAAWKTFVDQPVWGSGAGSYGVRFEKHRPEHFRDDTQWAHNDYLNTLSDYGLVGFGLFFGAVGTIAWCAVRARREAKSPERSTANASLLAGAGRERFSLMDHPYLPTAFAVGLLAFGLQLSVDFHFKIPALALAFATMAGMGVARRWPSGRAAPTTPKHARLRRWGCGIAAIAVAIGGMGWNLPRLRAEGIRYPLRRELDLLARREFSAAEKKAIARRAHHGFSTAIELDPDNAQAWADRAYVAAILGHLQPEREIELGREAERDARRALKESNAVSEFWLRLGVALDMQQRWNEAGPAISEGLSLAPLSATAWFYQAYHFALNPVTQPLARSAVATCLRLDPSLREGDALRRHLTAGR